MENEIVAAITSPDFLLVRIDPQFGGRYARVIHRSKASPSGRTCVLNGETDAIMAVVDRLKPGQYTAPGER